MSISKLAALLGTGSALLMSGLLLVGASAAMGLNALMPGLPQWLCFLVLGVIMLIGGFALVDRGGANTATVVEKELSAPGLIKNYPLATAGIAIFVGFLIYRILKPNKVVVAPVSDIASAGVPLAATASAAPPPPRKTLIDALVPLATAAGSMAAGVGMDALGIPSPAKLAQSLLDGLWDSPSEKQDDAKKPDEDQQQSQPQTASDRNGFHHTWQRMG